MTEAARLLFLVHGIDHPVDGLDVFLLLRHQDAEREVLRLGVEDVFLAVNYKASAFDSKESLLESLLADLLIEADHTVTDAGHSGDFADWQAVRWHVSAYWDTYHTHSAVLRSLQQAAIVSERRRVRVDCMVSPVG